MELGFIPKTTLGKYSVGLIVVMPICFYIGVSFVGFYSGVSAGETILQDVITRPGVAIPMLTGFISGIVAFPIGLISITRKKDHSILVFLSTAMGFLVLTWCLMEAFPR